MPGQLVDVVVARLADRVIAGEFGDDALPSEKVLAEQCEVSRLTLREGVKVLSAAGVLRVDRGRGTFVNPVARWTDVPLVARATGDVSSSALHLLETRRLIEVGAIRLATQRLTDTELDDIEACLDVMVEAHERADVPRFADADLGFHTRILTGTGNPFVPVLYAPIADTLRAGREETSSHAAVRDHAIGYHREILTALRQRDITAAADAMTGHLRQTRNDLQHYVLGDGA